MGNENLKSMFYGFLLKPKSGEVAKWEVANPIDYDSRIWAELNSCQLACLQCVNIALVIDSLSESLGPLLVKHLVHNHLIVPRNITKGRITN